MFRIGKEEVNANPDGIDFTGPFFETAYFVGGFNREGVGLHPMSQSLQEYSEMKAIYDEVQSLLAPEGGTVQMLGRLGYAALVGPSPRWPIEAKVVS